jgi:hypothetical protein
VDVLYHESTFYNQKKFQKDDAFNSKRGGHNSFEKGKTLDTRALFDCYEDISLLKGSIFSRGAIS